MWRIITIGRGLRSVRPSQCYPQDCSDEAPNYHHNDEVSKVYAATLRHCSVASSWSPLTVTRYNNVLRQATFGVTQPKDIHSRSHDNVDSRADGTYNRGCHQRCPPWHWHVLQDNKVLEECCTDEQEKEKEKQSQDDGGNTWQYQEWKEILQASPTLHTLGLGSAAALTLSLYRNWSELCPCPYQAKDQQNRKSNGANKKYNLKNDFPEEKGQKNEELFWSNCRTFKNFFNAEVHSQEISSDTVDKDCSGVTQQVPNHPSITAVCKLDGIKSAESEAPRSTIPVYSLQGKALDLAKTFFNIQGDVEKKHELEEIYEDVTLKDESELLLCLQSEKSNQTDRTDSGCMSDLHKDFQSQTTSNSAISKDEYNENKERNANRSLSTIGTERSVSIEPELQVEVSDAINEHTQGSRAHQESESCVDDAKLKTLHDRLFEIVKADREDQLQEVFKKDGNTLWDTKPEEAVVYFQAGVMMGDPSSTFNLALCYHMGYGITQDLEKARKLYEAAAAARHGWAIYNLAVMLSQGLGGPCVPQRVHSLLQQAANMGITEATKALSALEMGKQEQSITYEEPQLQKCYSVPSLGSPLTNHQSYSHSTDDLQFLLDEDDWTGSDLSIDICKKN